MCIVTWMTFKSKLSSFWAANNPFANILPEKSDESSSKDSGSRKLSKATRKLSLQLPSSEKLIIETSSNISRSSSQNETESTIAFGLKEKPQPLD